MSKEIVSGVGARYATIFNIDATSGIPLPATTTAVPMQGSLVEGIKSLAVNDPDPQRITHYGDDNPFAQDSLPPTEVGSFTIATAKTNMIIDAMLEGNKVRTIDSLQMRGGNSDKKGQEPQVVFFAYRQALDTKKGSATFGKLRQWEGKIYHSTRITPNSSSFEQGATDKTYDATPSPTQYTAWNEEKNETNWGQTRDEYTEMTTDYQPRWNFYRGNGTLTAFQLSHAPVTQTSVHIWSDGTLVTPATVNTSSTNPAFTLSAAPGNGKQVAALIETNSPGSN